MEKFEEGTIYTDMIRGRVLLVLVFTTLRERTIKNTLPVFAKEVREMGSDPLS